MAKKYVEKFNLNTPPLMPKRYLLPIEWAGSFPGLFLIRHKLKKINCKGLKPPYIILSNHASMVDFQVCIKATFPHRAQWVSSIEEFCGREWVFKRLGVIPKRKFTQGPSLIKQILTCIRKNKKSVIIYPEARFSLAGINEDIGDALGKLTKMAGVPVVILMQHGHFIRSPQWCKHPVRRFPMTAEFNCIISKEDTINLSAEELQKRIEDNFIYDDYAWQLENKIVIKNKMRAQNLHKILYQCPHCLKEFMMNSKGTKIWCDNCHYEWEMNEYGQLHCLNGEETFTHVPDWYRFERANVRKEVLEGRYHFEDDVRVEQLINSRIGFVYQGNAHMIHDEQGFTFSGPDFSLRKDVTSMASCHIEYDFKHRGDCLDMATLNNTWFVYPINATNVITKIHFATEELYRKARKDL